MTEAFPSREKCEAIRKWLCDGEDAGDIRKDAILAEAEAEIKKGSIASLERAIELLHSIPGWKDADARILTCQRRIKEQETAWNASKKARLKKYRKPLILSAVVAILLVIALTIVPLYNAPRIAERMKDAKVGDYITFGTYSQGENGEVKDIKWLVLDVQDGKVLLISKYALEREHVNLYGDENTWEHSSAYSLLNQAFLSKAFSLSERRLISKTDAGGKVFLLSSAEATKYFTSANALKCYPTEYAGNAEETCEWLLRTIVDNELTYVNKYGRIENDRYGWYSYIRPAIWVDLDA